VNNGQQPATQNGGVAETPPCRTHSTTMSDSNSRSQNSGDATDVQFTDAAVRNAITDRAGLDDTVTVETVIVDVSRDLNMDEQRVRKEFDKLEKNGFVYTAGSDDSAEVRLP
jgi:hypothetical protein